MGFNHNINMYGKIFHIQTEQVKRRNLYFACTQVFINGIVLWSKQLRLNSSSFHEQLKESHKNGFNFLKSLVHNDEILDPHQLYIPFQNLKKDLGRDLLSGDLFHENYQISLAGINNHETVRKIFRKTHHSYHQLDGSAIPVLIPLSSKRTIAMGYLEPTRLVYALLLDLPENQLSGEHFELHFINRFQEQSELAL